MSEIAFNGNGEPFDLPPTMAAWRVRKLKPKGAPEVVYGRDGLPLFLPLDADIEDLRREAPPPAEGRYRLDPVDEHRRAVANAQSSYVCVHAAERAPEPTAPAAQAAGSQTDTVLQLVNALIETQKRAVEMAGLYVSQFPVIVNSMSGVVRAAGDAGLPNKVPLWVQAVPEPKPAEPTGDARKDGDEDQNDDEDQDEDEESQIEESEIEGAEVAPEPGNDWAKLGMTAYKKLEPYIDPLVGALTSKLTKGAIGGANGRPTAGAAPVADIQAHMRAILAQLAPEEAAQAMQLAGELSVPEQLAHAQKLSTMSVAEGVAFVRAELARRGLAASEREMSAAEIDAHIAAIRAQLTPDDSKALELMVEELPYPLRRQYLENLASMSVAEALAKVRRELAGLNREFTAAHGTAEPRNARDARDPRAPRVAPVRTTKATSPSGKPTAHPASPAQDPARRDRLRIVRAPLAVSPPSATDRASTAPPTPATAPGGQLNAPSTQTHIAAIQSVLTDDENTAARAYVAALTQADRSAWIATLLMLPVPEAVAMIRAALAAAAAPVSARGAESTAEAHAPEVVPPVSEPTPRNLGSLTSAPLASATAADAAAQPEPLVVDVPMAPVVSMSVVSAPVVSAPVVSAPVVSAPVVSAPDTAMAPVVAVGSPAIALADAAAAPAPAAAPGETSPTLDETARAHLAAVDSALTDEEREVVHAMMAMQPPEERQAWSDRLLARSVTDAAQILRETIHDLMTELDGGEPHDGSGALNGGALHDNGDELDDSGELDGGELDGGEPDSSARHDAPQINAPVTHDREHAPHGAPSAPPQALALPGGLANLGLLTLDAQTSAHFRAIWLALAFTEQMRLVELAARRPAAELRDWIADLARRPVPDALAKLRAALAAADAESSTAKKGDVS